MGLKKYLLASAILGVASVSGFISPAYAADPVQPVVIVDYERLVQQSKAFTEGAKTFDEKFKARNDALEKVGQELQKENSELEKLKADLDNSAKSGVSGSTLRQKETTFNTRVAAFEKKYSDYQTQLNQLQKEMSDFQNVELEKVDKLVRDIVAKYASQNKIILVLDARSAIYYSNAADITSQLIKLVQ